MYQVFKIIAIGIACLVVTSVSAVTKSNTTIMIRDQYDFDNLQNILNESVSSDNKSIIVDIAPGKYLFADEHLTLNDLYAPNVSITIRGDNDVYLQPNGKAYSSGDLFEGNFYIYDSWMSDDLDVPNWSHIRYADGIVEVNDVDKKLCRIKTKKDLEILENSHDSYILIPCWFRSWIYKISKIEDGYIYFVADNLKVSYKNGYNVNDDFNYGKKEIRYKLCNIKTNDDCLKVIDDIVSFSDGLESVWNGKACNFMTINNCVLSKLEINGIEFRGNSSSNENSLLSFNKLVSVKAYIKQCTFRGIHSNVISINSSPNITVENNYFQDCYCHGVISDNISARTSVLNNSFCNMGKRMQSSFCISCSGENYLVQSNKIINYGYGGIRVGVWYNKPQYNASCGIVENNELIYTEDYIKDIDDKGIMDGGAIYLFTKNDGAIIRGNYIASYTGMKDNRGIFCDDGAYNYQIYGNIILGITNSYSIDSPRCSTVERHKTPHSGVERANINNVIRDNIVDTPIRFEGYEESNNGCIKGINYILQKKEKELLGVYKNVSISKDDVYISLKDNYTGELVVSSNDYKAIRKSPSWKLLKRYVRAN